MKLMLPRLALLSLALALFAGCTTRSISNSSYDAARGRPDTHYRGELSDLDVVGVAIEAKVEEQDIRKALAEAVPVRLAPTSRVMLIQSGAEFPDDPMVAGLRARFDVQPFSGVPTGQNVDSPTYSKSLRLAAARGGYDKIVCYWGVLESEEVNKATKVISWVPLAGFLIPDERQSMRIRLRAVIVDVASGRWTYVSPASVASSGLSSIVSRRNTDQSLVAELKEAGYKNLVQALAENRG
jgi:hypothetical protein